MLDSLARALLRDFFCYPFLVHAAVEHCPCNLAWVLTLQEQSLGFVSRETEDLGVPADEESPLAGVDLVV